MALSQTLSAQKQINSIKINDSILVDYIRTVEFRNISSELSMPIMTLNSGRLICEFDDSYGEFIDYYYTIRHCDKNWNFTKNIEISDYLDGPQEVQIENFASSVNTIMNYTHYSFSFPNQDIQLRWSGNYLLIVYDDAGDIVFTRRFYVIQDIVSIILSNERPNKPGIYNTHQAFTMTIDMNNLNPVNPLDELWIQGFQNRMNERLTPLLKPTFIAGTKANFNLMDQAIFPGYKEYRFFNIRPVLQAGERVNSIEISNTHALILLNKDERRNEKSHYSQSESNGAIIYRNTDFPNSKKEISSEYPHVIFTLQTFYEQPGDVYVIGEFNDFKRNKAFKMEYLPEHKSYSLEVPLKQGYYNYLYAMDTGERDLSLFELEGSSYETENEYYFFCYYRPRGTEYDQIVGHILLPFNSRF